MPNDEPNQPTKRPKTEQAVDLADYINSHVLGKEEELKNLYADAEPYRHGVLRSVFVDTFVKRVQSEIKRTSKVNFKESDLFRVYQSIDMANLSEEEHGDLPSVLELRKVLYSDQWRSLVERICGLEKGTLTGKVDCACNCHTTGCHLLCHDDVIGTRKISYILYLTEEEPGWAATEGGALELYDREEAAQPGASTPGLAKDPLSVAPASVPSATLVPTFNNMAFFAVEPGVSFHSVQEVLGDRPRLSLQGWYHAAEAPDRIEAATLQQLKRAVEREEAAAYEPIHYPPAEPTTPGDEGSTVQMNAEDREFLAGYLHETYLTDTSLENIRGKFEEDSSVQLRNFFKSEWVEKLKKARLQEEEASKKSVGEEGYYKQGVSEEWTLIGPAHKQRYLEYLESSSGDENSIGGLLLHLKKNLLCSVPFQRFLAQITSLGLPNGQRGRIRRFRRGLDYTVAHYGILTKKSVLDATLCFVAGEGQALEDGDEIDGRDVAWQSGDCGGFECYIAADEDSGEAADEYNQDDDTELLSVSASNNTLSLVFRDPGTMRFIKYVGASAPSSRWDIAMEYSVEDTSDGKPETAKERWSKDKAG